MSGRRALGQSLGLVAAAMVLALTGCVGSVAPPKPAAGVRSEDRRPVVLVPGVTGTALRNVATGEMVWGTGWRLLAPRDRGYGVALPLREALRSRLEPAGAIEEMRLGPYRKPVYRPVADRFAAAGYAEGDPQRPEAGGSYFAFGYDWRRSNVESAATLRRFLERLRAARGDGILEVDLICQSNGAHVCRYLAKYGGASLEDAEGGRGGLGDGIRVRNLVLVGASNGGSLRIFQMLQRGRRYLGLLGRLWSPEVLFTFPSFFEDLPHYRPDLFLGPNGESLDVDLFDPHAWRERGWSVFGPEVERAVARARRPDLFGDAAERRQHLEEVLRNAVRFQALLAADLPLPGTEVYIVEGPGAPTPARAVLAAAGDSPRLWFAGDRELKGRGLESRMLTPGDAHATAESVRHLSRVELEALADEPLVVDAGHFEMILEPETLEKLVAWLSD